MNSFGRLFKITIYGESHSSELGLVLSGIKPGIALNSDDFSLDLKRRKSGSKGTTKRVESDLPLIVSGLYKGRTTGAPLNIKFENNNIKSQDYDKFQEIPRPSHADLTAKVKYNSYNDYRGGGMFSGRMTLLLTAAGVVAKKILKSYLPNIDLSATLKSIGEFTSLDDALDSLNKQGDSLGGVVELYGKGFPIGLGEPFFDSLEGNLSHLIFSIPGVKGIEFGSGFKSSVMTGSLHNDCYINHYGECKSNNSGGINGGISNGNPLNFRVAFKPTPSITLDQESFNFKTKKQDILKIEGRHDQAFVLRTPVIIEACTAIVLLDFYLINKSLYS